MSLDRPAVLGLVLGVAIGAGFGLLQRWALARGPQLDGVGRAFGGAVLRFVALLVAIGLVWRFTGANRVWLIGGIMGAYGILFVATMIKAMRQQK